jgi:hypothetical protein
MAAGVLSGGCSVIFHVDASQCSTTGDCQARGAAFNGYTCSKGQCIPPVIDADAGDGGSTIECLVNNDCANKGFVSPDFACDVSTHTCVSLTTADCPVYIGDISSTTAPPIFVGAFAIFPQGAPLSHPSYANYKMALGEFASNGPGIPAGPPTPVRRTPVAIACDAEGDTAGITRAMTHLINDVHVPVVVTALQSATLANTFGSFTLPSTNLLFIDAFGANSRVEPPALTTNGLLWHMLGQPGDVAPAYVSFLPLLEGYMRRTAPWNLGSTAPLKVATVTSANTIETGDLQFAVQDNLTWNGVDFATNSNNGYFKAFTIADSSLNGTDPATIDTADPAQAIADWQPNVIISFASEEFTFLFQNIEVDWAGEPSPGPRPFYLVGPYNYLSTELAAQVALLPYSSSGEGVNAVRRRMAGITVASPNDARTLQVYNAYKSAYLSANPGGDVNQNNYYDAMYFAVYSLIGAGRNAGVVGTDLVSGGMKNLISTSSSQQLGMGPTSDMGTIFGDLTNGNPIGLTGTLGPPNFNSALGARIGTGDVYCLDTPAVDGGPLVYEPDVLRLTDAGAGPDGSDFTGTFPCFPGLQ